MHCYFFTINFSLQKVKASYFFVFKVCFNINPLYKLRPKFSFLISALAKTPFTNKATIALRTQKPESKTTTRELPHIGFVKQSTRPTVFPSSSKFFHWLLWRYIFPLYYFCLIYYVGYPASNSMIFIS